MSQNLAAAIPMPSKEEQLEQRILRLIELRDIAKALQSEIDAMETAVKDGMEALNLEKVSVGEHSVSWKDVTTSRLDTAALKEQMPEIARRFMTTTTTRRFSIR